MSEIKVLAGWVLSGGCEEQSVPCLQLLGGFLAIISLTLPVKAFPVSVFIST